MKTAKLVLSILGVALTTLSFGQLLSLHETNNTFDLHIARMMETEYELQNKLENEVLFYTSEYNTENGRTIHRVNHNPMNNVLSATYITPLESRAYFARKVEAMHEEIPVVETWMTTPFESSLEDSELRIEDWMITPFDSEFYEEALEIEPWMTSNWF
jgi:hypothetical protein